MVQRKRVKNDKEKSQFTNQQQDTSTTFPEACLVCDTPINRNSVLFHCECVVAMCSTCAVHVSLFFKS